MLDNWTKVIWEQCIYTVSKYHSTAYSLIMKGKWRLARNHLNHRIKLTIDKGTKWHHVAPCCTVWHPCGILSCPTVHHLNARAGTSLVVQWFRLWFPPQGAQVPFLVGELRSRVLLNVAGNKKDKGNNQTKSRDLLWRKASLDSSKWSRTKEIQ